MVRVAKPDAGRTGDATAQRNGPGGDSHGARRPAAHRDRRTAADTASGDGHGAIYGAAYRDWRPAADTASAAASGTERANTWAGRAIALTLLPHKMASTCEGPHCQGGAR
jgi:hypothetical protein